MAHERKRRRWPLIVSRLILLHCAPTGAMCLVRTITLLMLFLLAGCRPDSTTLESTDAAPFNESTELSKAETGLTIIAVPRPNSGEFTTGQATKLLPEFLERSAPILATDDIITKWKSPTQGIRVHVNADETVEVVNYVGTKAVGADTINDALDSTMTFGNARSVLLTSDNAGWETPMKRQVVTLLFQPSVQIYIVVGK